MCTVYQSVLSCDPAICEHCQPRPTSHSLANSQKVPLYIIFPSHLLFCDATCACVAVHSQNALLPSSCSPARDAPMRPFPSLRMRRKGVRWLAPPPAATTATELFFEATTPNEQLASSAFRDGNSGRNVSYNGPVLSSPQGKNCRSLRRGR